MRNILILLLIGSLNVIIADVLKECSDESNCSIKKEKSFEMIHGISLRTLNVNTDNVDTSTTRKAYNNRVNASFYNVKFTSDIDLYDLTGELGKIQNTSLAYKDDTTNLQSGYQINALYLTIDLGDYISLYGGSIPFKGGRFSEIKDPTINGGNGLAIINNQVYSSGFISP
jgi:hypothetical protein